VDKHEQSRSKGFCVAEMLLLLLMVLLLLQGDVAA
jgi:competence protein ComGC